MSKIKVDKVVSGLPVPLVANTIYAVRVGLGFDLLITDATGATAHKLNSVEKETFESISKNLNSYSFAPSYSANGDMSAKTFDLGGGKNIVKTWTYLANGDIDKIVLSGDVPNGIKLTKTFVYTGENLTNLTYS